jgi:hypothetical protein
VIEKSPSHVPPGTILALAVELPSCSSGGEASASSKTTPRKATTTMKYMSFAVARLSHGSNFHR